MPSRHLLLLSIALIVAIIGSLLLIFGPSLPLPPSVTLIFGMGCFFIVVIFAVLALYNHQQAVASERRD